MLKKRKIDFIAYKKVSKPVAVKFYTKKGPVSFKAIKKVSKPVKVKFYTKRNREM